MRGSEGTTPRLSVAPILFRVSLARRSLVQMLLESSGEGARCTEVCLEKAQVCLLGGHVEMQACVRWTASSAQSFLCS